MIRKRDFWGAVMLVVLIVVCAVVWYVVLHEERQGVLTVAFLDVGQGDAIFIESPSGRQMLIDGGPNGTVLRELARVMPWYDRTIDVVVATHPDADHIGGLVSVLNRFHISYMVESGAVNDTPIAESLQSAITDSRATSVLARRGQIIDLGDNVYAEVLFPDRDLSTGSDTNMASIIVRVVYGDTAFMLTGDAPQSIEEYVMRLDGVRLKSDVLKAGHHGSKTSSEELFVGFVAPTYGVYSRGCDNRYGHPHEETVDTFTQFGVETFDTCDDGAVIFTSDGNSVTHLQ